MLGGCSLKATESPRLLSGAECSHQMKRRRVRPPMPAVNSKRLMAGEVLQAARVSTAMEKNMSIGLNGSREQTYCTGSRCIKPDLLQFVILQFMYCPTTLLAGTHAKHRPGLVSRDRCGGLSFQGSCCNVAGVLLASTDYE